MIIQLEQDAGKIEHGNTRHGLSTSSEYKQAYNREYKKCERQELIESGKTTRGTYPKYTKHDPDSLAEYRREYQREYARKRRAMFVKSGKTTVGTDWKNDCKNTPAGSAAKAKPLPLTKTPAWKKAYQIQFRIKNKTICVNRVKKCRQEMRDHPELYNCDCGNVGAMLKTGFIVCERCNRLEDYSLQQSIRNRKMTEELTRAFNEILAESTWINLWDKGFVTNAEKLLPQIDSRIEDDGKTITVYGHGKYELPIVDNERGRARLPGSAVATET